MKPTLFYLHTQASIQKMSRYGHRVLLVFWIISNKEGLLSSNKPNKTWKLFLFLSLHYLIWLFTLSTLIPVPLQRRACQARDVQGENGHSSLET